MEYKELYEKLNDEFQSYQKFAGIKLQRLKDANKQLEKSLGVFTNIVEMAKYINLYIFDDGLLDKVNDSIIGMLGVSYSTIHIFNGFSLEPKVTNFNDLNATKIHYELEALKDKKSFLVNELDGIFKADKKREKVNALIAVPIEMNDDFIGYIIVEHKYYAFFNKDDIKFLEYISNEVAMVMTNRNLYKKIQESAKRDVLLDIYNRKHFYEILSNISKERIKNGFSIVMSDIDNFKKINDTYGHQVGDYALKHVVNIMNFNLDENDVMARYGGEEMIMLIDKKKDRSELINKIEKVRKSIETIPLNLVDGKKITITMSFGMAFIDENTEKIDIDNTIKIADENLYRAKANGKNRVEFS